MHQIKIEVTHFSAAHRLGKGYQGKCEHLHGHDYRVWVTLDSSQLNSHDFVADFSEIKHLLKAWLNENLDHATLVASTDQKLIEFLKQEQQKLYILPDQKNPTAEAIAEHLFYQFDKIIVDHKQQFNPEARLTSVEVWETQTFCGIYHRI